MKKHKRKGKVKIDVWTVMESTFGWLAIRGCKVLLFVDQMVVEGTIVWLDSELYYRWGCCIESKGIKMMGESEVLLGGQIVMEDTVG